MIFTKKFSIAFRSLIKAAPNVGLRSDLNVQKTLSYSTSHLDQLIQSCITKHNILVPTLI